MRVSRPTLPFPIATLMTAWPLAAKAQTDPRVGDLNPRSVSASFLLQPEHPTVSTDILPCTTHFLSLCSDEAFRIVDEGTVIVLLALLLVPVVRYLWAGWAFRREEIFAVMSRDAAALYFRQFYHPDYLIDSPPSVVGRILSGIRSAVARLFQPFFGPSRPTSKIQRLFRQHYHRSYGRRHYIVPFALLFAVTTFALVVSALKISAFLIDPRGTGFAHTLPWTVVAATAGAYMWVVSDFIARSRSRDLAPAIIYWATLRFAIAIPAGFALNVAKDDFAPPLAFLLGALPTQTLITIARRLATKKLGLSAQGDNKKSELESIQGISAGLAERFEEEGISTISQLAYTDPIDLTIRSNFSLDYVCDCVSQALAWVYLGKDYLAARDLSLRGAREIAAFVGEFENRENPRALNLDPRAILTCLAESMNWGTTEVAERMLHQIARHPHTQFISKMWESGTKGAPEERQRSRADRAPLADPAAAVVPGPPA